MFLDWPIIGDEPGSLDFVVVTEMDPVKYALRMNLNISVTETVQVKLLDVMGSTVAIKEYLRTSGFNVFDLDITNLEIGHYTHILNAGNQSFQGKVLRK